EVAGGQLDIAIENCEQLARRFLDAAIHRRREARIAAHGDDTRASRAGQIWRAVVGAVIDGEHFASAQGLPVERVEEPRQQLAAVPNRHDGGDAHRKKRFFTRKARLAKPSRQALSLVSPRRELYMIEISPKRMRELRSASILISSLNAMPSL